MRRPFDFLKPCLYYVRRRTFDFLCLALLRTHRCKRCNGDKKNLKAFSTDNDMDPGVPPQMEGMTHVEQILIAKVAPIMFVYRLKGRQYAHGGHDVNTPQDVTGFATSLPRLAADIPVLVVRRQGVEAEPHKDFVARRHKVYHALLRLKENNQYYRNISIDTDALNRFLLFKPRLIRETYTERPRLAPE